MKEQEDPSPPMVAILVVAVGIVVYTILKELFF
jgi:hypothetical protein